MSNQPLDSMLCFALYAAGQAMQQTYATLLAPLDLTYPQYLVLKVLWAGDGATVGRLCTTLGLETNTLSPLLKRLEQAGLLRRSRDLSDERQVLIHLTPAGCALQDRAAHVDGCAAAATGLSSDAIMDMTAMLHRLSAQLRSSRAQAQRAASATAASGSDTSAAAAPRNPGNPELPMA